MHGANGPGCGGRCAASCDVAQSPAQKVFFRDNNYRAYRELLIESCAAARIAVWTYCLMPNHVHLILVPRDEDGLRAALSEAHRRYSRSVRFCEGRRGYLWQGRFAFFPMAETYLLASAHYVELNPVRANQLARAGQALVECAGAFCRTR